MKKIYIGLLLSLLTLIGVSCQNSKCSPCPIGAINMIMKLRIVDKTTGADLFLSPTSPYKPTDLKVTSSIDTGFHVRIDSLAVSGGFVVLPDPQSLTYTVQLANLSADHIKVVTGLQYYNKCCANDVVNSITVNDNVVCAPCSLQQDVVIKK